VARRVGSEGKLSKKSTLVPLHEPAGACYRQNTTQSLSRTA
jgi:hypothetical protein